MSHPGRQRHPEEGPARGAQPGRLERLVEQQVPVGLELAAALHGEAAARFLATVAEGALQLREGRAARVRRPLEAEREVLGRDDLRSEAHRGAAAAAAPGAPGAAGHAARLPAASGERPRLGEGALELRHLEPK